ncbi:hypothetical protein F5Y12DRAFT_413073 [Xylaria sp. FL1777]|nr:hypothetical protein F5Y12DRAFT_413073 [Xylaria sp. FL1777]
MENEPWRIARKSEGFVSLAYNFNHLPTQVFMSLRTQRPWHSKIRLPIEADKDREADFCHLESHDLDCLIIIVRMSISLGFTPDQVNLRNAITKCADHNFGWHRRADYQAKGMLVSKLFPDDIGNMQVLRSKLTFENLLKHPGVNKVIFACQGFALKDRQLIISNRAPELASRVESIKTCSYEDITDANEVRWDGIKSLGQAVADQSYDQDVMAEDGTKISRRYCTVPKFIRVVFTPDKNHPRGFKDVKRFHLVTPTLRYGDDGTVREIMSDSTYHIYAAVKMDPTNPVDNPAEVRVYDVQGRKIEPEVASNEDHRAIIEEKLKADSRWSMGDPSFKFILFYREYPPSEDYIVPEVSPVEYQLPSPVYRFYLPPPPTPPTPEQRSRSSDSTKSDRNRGRRRGEESYKTLPFRTSRHHTPARFSQESDEENDKDISSYKHTSSIRGGRDREQDNEGALQRALQRALERQRALEQELAREGNRASDHQRVLEQELARERNRAIDRQRALERELAIGRALGDVLERKRALEQELARERAHQQEMEQYWDRGRDRDQHGSKREYDYHERGQDVRRDSHYARQGIPRLPTNPSYGSGDATSQYNNKYRIDQKLRESERRDRNFQGYYAKDPYGVGRSRSPRQDGRYQRDQHSATGSRQTIYSHEEQRSGRNEKKDNHVQDCG